MHFRVIPTGVGAHYLAQRKSINQGFQCELSPALSFHLISERISWMWTGRTKRRPSKRKRKSRRHRLAPTIFDHLHRIPQATHLLQLCSRDVMSGGSVAFNYSHLGSIYASAARSFHTRKEKNLCSGDFMGVAGWSPSFLLAASLSFPMCSDSLYISFCMLVVLNYDIISS